MRSTLTTWLLLLGLLLPSVASVLPAQRVGQAEQLAHEWVHAIDHGHHRHGTAERADAGRVTDLGDHDRDAALAWNAAADPGGHGPHHIHASEAGQVLGLPVPARRPAQHQPTVPPEALNLLPLRSADPDSLLRPPQTLT